MGAIVKSDEAEQNVLPKEKPVILDVHWKKELETTYEQKMILFTKEITEARLKSEKRNHEYQSLLKHYQQIMYDRYHLEIYGLRNKI